MSRKDDGIVGPKTTESFNQIAKKIDPDEFSMSLGKSLGFQW